MNVKSTTVVYSSLHISRSTAAVAQ